MRQGTGPGAAAAKRGAVGTRTGTGHGAETVPGGRVWRGLRVAQQHAAAAACVRRSRRGARPAGGAPWEAPARQERSLQSGARRAVAWRTVADSIT